MSEEKKTVQISAELIKDFEQMYERYKQLVESVGSEVKSFDEFFEDTVWIEHTITAVGFLLQEQWTDCPHFHHVVTGAMDVLMQEKRSVLMVDIQRTSNNNRHLDGIFLKDVKKARKNKTH